MMMSPSHALTYTTTILPQHSSKQKLKTSLMLRNISVQTLNFCLILTALNFLFLRHNNGLRSVLDQSSMRKSAWWGL